MDKYTAEYLTKLGLPFLERVEDYGDVRVLRLRGAMDKETLPKVLGFRHQILKDRGPSQRHLLLDLLRVTRVDSAAVAALLLNLSQQRAEGKSLGIVNITADLRRMLDVFRYTEIFRIYDSEDEAIRDLNG